MSGIRLVSADVVPAVRAWRATHVAGRSIRDGRVAHQLLERMRAHLGARSRNRLGWSGSRDAGGQGDSTQGGGEPPEERHEEGVPHRPSVLDDNFERIRRVTAVRHAVEVFQVLCLTTLLSFVRMFLRGARQIRKPTTNFVLPRPGSISTGPVFIACYCGPQASTGGFTFRIGGVSRSIDLRNCTRNLRNSGTLRMSR